MTGQTTVFRGAAIFDGLTTHGAHALLVQGRRVVAVVAETDIPKDAATETLDGGILAPGFVDLQVNGGGGVMFNDSPTVETLRIMARAHAGLGATSILPTLITDTPDMVQAAVGAVDAAIADGVAGIAGLHLEGPHLSRARKGAHDPSLIRPMEPADLAFLLEAARRLPVLKVTIAPESVDPAQMKLLSNAGILLSLGHCNASYEQCLTAAKNGVRCVTHLYNAMSQLGNREPGLVGAALDCGDLSAGLIADLIHVHETSIKVALRAKNGPGRIFLVSDAMATAGAPIDHFFLNGRQIDRRANRLSLADGTLAGADLDLATAVRNVAVVSNLDLGEAIAMATSIPATLIGKQNSIGHLAPGLHADFIHIRDGELASVWQSGVRVSAG
ncbi:MAG: N-acetylglucosamine-6-phosphate deacetylase [Rhodobacteraceae bacterium]|nr:N-acetylglucosamine-6-phosphate deacetylase [Paracoccaceae bacterium]